MMKADPRLLATAPRNLPTLARPTLGARWLPEPSLRFAGDAEHLDPKVGIPLYGPRSFGTGRHPAEIHVGFVGTAEAVDRAQRFLAQAAGGVDGDTQHHPFPGCEPGEGFRSDLRLDDDLVERITTREMHALLDITKTRERFERALALLDEKMALLQDRDHPLDCVFIVIPESLFKACRSVKYRQNSQLVERDLRRAFKAMAMRYRIPTQFLRESTTGLTDTRRQMDHPSEIAWNLFTGLYFKAGGLPWSPADITPGTCFIGVSFFRPMGSDKTLRTSVVQAFDENGDGLVLRGHDFRWDEARDGRSPHLPEDLAADLVRMVLDRYRKERKQTPRRVVVHKSSLFTGPERAGFQDGLDQVAEHDLVCLAPRSDVRLMRQGQYPPLRGTTFALGDDSYLYATGYIPALGYYPQGHVPTPLLVADHVGDTPHDRLLREILLLTKMNWNSAEYAEALPITLRFSRLVGAVLREVPADQEPATKYSYYM
ncbi:hypothetical protein [Micromonospora sp. HK10]|uniref:argonaute/piwi family protein n=1 Tax=Micromonospora sp. HK10 TaxID=1538294 RepID=UPI000698710C|nr:hypothetical protein [Micromonospora sp. HK10]